MKNLFEDTQVSVVADVQSECQAKLRFEIRGGGDSKSPP